MLIYGKNSVLERLKANPDSIKKIFLQENFDDAGILEIIKSKNIPHQCASTKNLPIFKRNERLQGIAAEVSGFKYNSFRELMENRERNSLSFIFLDGLTDPQNLGAIIRIAACLGGFAVVIPEHESCEVNETVLNVASGGENYVQVCKVGNFTNALIQAKKYGYWIAATVVENGEDIRKTSLPFPLCLVIGSEGKGIHYGVNKQAELRLSLPMKGAALSFNAAMACAIFCYEITRQRQDIS
ncbi:MAG: 23S rRNA (guanosine(2251)-2'-O)-methyltransferase RlmB [Candidatus Omnitrophota bacterium]